MKGIARVKEWPRRGSVRARHRPNVGPTRPAISIKQAYLDAPAPEPSTGGDRAKGWPVQVGQFKVDIRNFPRFLSTGTSLNEQRRTACKVYITRLSHMLSVEGHDLPKEEDVSTPVVLAALYMSVMYKEMFSLPLMAPSFTWSRKMTDAFRMFCDWQKAGDDKQHLMTGQPHLLKLSSALGQLSFALKTGIRKQQMAAKKQKERGPVHRGRRENPVLPPDPDHAGSGTEGDGCIGPDQKRFQWGRTTAMQRPIGRKCCPGGHYLAERYRGAEARVGSNGKAALPGATGGKALTISSAAHIRHQASTAVWPNGLPPARSNPSYIYIYLSLPCRENVTTLFVPVQEGTKSVNIPQSLKTFLQSVLTG